MEKLLLASGLFELDYCGVIHYRNLWEGSGYGEIEFDCDFDGPDEQSVQSATKEAIRLFCAEESEHEKVEAVIRKMFGVPKPGKKPIKLSASELGFIYMGLLSAAGISRDHGHNDQAREFHAIAEKLNDARMGNGIFTLTEDD